MRKLLPLGDFHVETYQGISFILAIMQGNRNVENVLYNKYINLECNITNNIAQLNLSFAGVLWEDYRLAGLAEMSMYDIKNLSQEKFIGFLQERIEQENYILMYSIDEYYLAYTTNYMTNHSIHDTYIYGYDEKVFYVSAYKGKRLQRISVPHNEIVQALFSLNNIMDFVSFCTYKPNNAVHVPVNLEKIKNEYRNYLNECVLEKTDMVYGMGVYNELIKCIQTVIESCENIEIDIRSFRCLWEHKKISLDRAIKIKDDVLISEEKIVLLNEIVCISRRIFLMMIKYNCAQNKDILKRSIKYIQEMKNLEFQYVDWLIANI